PDPIPGPLQRPARPCDVGPGDGADQPTPESTERRRVKHEDDPFDLANLRLTHETAAAMGRTQSKRRSGEPSTKCPHRWETGLLKARRISSYRVALHLLYLHWKSNGRPIPLSNVALVAKGVTRQSKWNALIELASLGLIKIEKRPQKSPVIRMVVE